MSCGEYKANLIELARGQDSLEARRHAEGCRRCALFLEEQINLTQWECAIATDAGPPPNLEASLLSEYMESGPQPRRRAATRHGVWIASGALAATVVLGWLMKPVPKAMPATVRTTRQTPEAIEVARSIQPRRRPKRARPPSPETPSFLPVPYAPPLEPWERAEIVRMEMPVSALIAAGFPVETSDAAALASADVVVGQDGRARAVRLISISDRSIEP